MIGKCKECGTDIVEYKKEVGYKLLVPTKIHLLSSVVSVDSIKVPGIYYFNPNFNNLVEIYNSEKGIYEKVRIHKFLKKWILQVYKNTYIPAGIKHLFHLSESKDAISGFRAFWWSSVDGLSDHVYEKGVNPLIVKQNSFVIWGIKVIIGVGGNIKLSFIGDKMITDDKAIVNFSVLVVLYNSLLFIRDRKNNIQQFFNWLMSQRIVNSIYIENKQLCIQENGLCDVIKFSLRDCKKNMKEFNTYFKFEERSL